MADIYVEIGTMNSNDTDADPELKKTMPKVMEEAANDTVKKTKGITDKKPKKGEKAKAYSFSGRLVSLTIDSSNVLNCDLDMILTTWPGRSLLSASIKKSDGKRLPTDPTEKQIKDTAAELVASTTTKITKKTLEYLIANEP